MVVGVGLYDGKNMVVGTWHGCGDGRAHGFDLVVVRPYGAAHGPECRHAAVESTVAC